MALAANRATRENVLVADAQQRFEFAIDADVDILPCVRTGEMQPFHAGLRVQYGPVCILFGCQGVGMTEFGSNEGPVHTAVSWGPRLRPGAGQGCFYDLGAASQSPRIELRILR